MRYAVIQRDAPGSDDGTVINIAIWDGIALWALPDDAHRVASDAAAIGWRYESGVFVPAEPLPPGGSDPA